MKRVILLLMLLLCTSCYYRHADDIKITSDYYLRNNTNRTIEVHKGGKFYFVLEVQKRLLIYTTGFSSDYDEVSMERAMIEHPEAFEDISIYDVTDGDRVFLKTWTFAERDKEGRQLYDLSDCVLEVSSEKDTPLTSLYFDYIFTVYPEDVGL